jgi:hypothetical protein
MSLSKLDGDVLKVKVPYEQIKPHVASELHCHDHPELSPIVSLEESKATEEKETREKPSPIESTDSASHEDVFKAQSKDSSGSTEEQNQNDVVYCSEKREVRGAYMRPLFLVL